MPYHVLIVDDQKVVSRLLRSALETIETIEQGLVVSEAPSGEEAILEASRTRIDLLVVDFRLPGISGVELVNKFRALHPDCKIIMISGVTDPRYLKQIKESGVDAFFSKPVPIGEFLDTVESSLGLASTILRPGDERQSTSTGPDQRPGLGDLLVNLRKNLGAQAVLLLNELGEIVAEAGKMPGLDGNTALFSALLGLFSAAQKAASLINRAETHLHVFHGSEVDGVFLPVGPSHALLLVGKGLAGSSELPSRLELLYKTRLELLEALSRVLSGTAKSIGIPAETDSSTHTRVAASDEPVTLPEDLPGDFMNIFKDIGKKTDDANSFWDAAVEKGTTFSEPDKLSYDQASRLGLTPDSATDK